MALREVKLGISNRLQLLQILPREGNFITLKTLRELRESLVPTEKEKEQVDLKEIPNGLIRWDLDKEKAMEVGTIAMTESMFSLVVKTLKDLDAKNKLTDAQLELYEVFVLAAPDPIEAR